MALCTVEVKVSLRVFLKVVSRGVVCGTSVEY